MPNGWPTKKVRKDVSTVRVNLSQGEYLSFSLLTQGAQAIFSFACQHRTLLTQADFDSPPSQKYEWTWGKSPSDTDKSDDVYLVALSFLDATMYTLKIEHRRSDSTMIELLKDLDIESHDPAILYREPLHVLSV